MAGTPYDFVEEFNERYKEDGIIWFFDIFSMNSYGCVSCFIEDEVYGVF